MTVYQYVTGQYNGPRKSIDLWCRTEDGEKALLSVMGFEPYMYVPENEPVPDAEWITRVEHNLDFIDGTKVKRIVVADPLQVRDHRDEFSITHESKIRFVQRFLIDTGIRSCFETDARGGIVPYNLITPVDRVIPPVVVFIDIETKSEARFPNWRNPTAPVIAVSFWDTIYKKYITVMVDTPQKEGKTVEGDWIKIRVTSSKRLAEICSEYLTRVKGDVITGWNISFDIDYFNAWMKANFNTQLPLAGYEVFDLLGAYSKIRSSLGYRLKEVVLKEGIVRREDMVAEQFNIGLYNNAATRNQFMLYSKKDVEYCVQLDRGFTNVKTGDYVEYNIIDRFWDDKNFAGLEDIEGTSSHTKRHDVFWLRCARRLNIVMPATPDKAQRSSLKYGGIVFNPPAGLYSNLTVLDMSRYYPTILMSFAKETSPDIWGKLGPEVIGDLYAERDKWEAELDKHQPGTESYKLAYRKFFMAKTFLSGSWGYFVFPGSRIYNPEKGDFVLKTAQDGLKLLRAEAEKLGHKTVYGDTDSILLEAEMDEVEDLVIALNAVLHDWAIEKGVPPNFRVKEDRYARNTLFVEMEGKKRGAKKKYAQWIVREGGRECDYIEIKGFAFVRGNTSEVTRSLQQKVLEAVIRRQTEGLVKTIQEEIEKIRTGTYDIDDITVPVNLGMKIEDAKSGEYYLGAQYNIKHIKEEIVAGDRVRFFKAKYMPPGYPTPKGRWVAYIDKWSLPKGIEIDYDWLIDRTVRSPTERILDAAGISWMTVLGLADARDLFE